MLILLPPSEGKNEPIAGKVFTLRNLSFHGNLGAIRSSLISTNLDLKRCRPAHEIYSGVLYQALDWKSLPVMAARRGEKSVVVISALFGALRMSDVIPTYKLKISTSLWKKAVGSALEELDADLVVDCRSSTYCGVWNPDPARTVAVRVFHIKNGKRSVITHMSKKYRGELTRYLLLEKVSPSTPAALKVVASKHFTCELVKSEGKNPAYLDLIIKEG
jgi:cytoplasmic iron level regulating protein YaaA (DUF328/UPF0246 family)